MGIFSGKYFVYTSGSHKNSWGDTVRNRKAFWFKSNAVAFAKASSQHAYVVKTPSMVGMPEVGKVYHNPCAK